MKDSNVRYIARYSAIRGVLIAILAAVLLILAIVFFVTDLAPAGIGMLVVALIAGAIASISILRAKMHKILVYDNKVVEKQGILITNEKSSLLVGVVGVSVRQGLCGKLFNYGDVVIDKVGRGWDISTEGICKPYQLKRYFEAIIDQTKAETPGSVSPFLGN